MAARAQLVSFSPRRRRSYAARATDLVHELTGVVGTGSLRSAVVEAALAVASQATVVVLVGGDELAADDRVAADALAGTLARHGLAVLMVGDQDTAVRDDSGPVLVESGARAGHE